MAKTIPESLSRGKADTTTLHMANFEEILEDLLKDCGTLLLPQKVAPSEAFFFNRDQRKAWRIKKERSALTLDAQTWTKILNLETYEACRAAFEKENVFKDAPRLAGHWGTFPAILYDVIHFCGRVQRNTVAFDEQCVRQRLCKHRMKLSASEVIFTSNARLLGVRLQCKEIALVDGLSLHRLDKKQISEEQSVIERDTSQSQALRTSFHTTELRASLTVSVDRDKDNAFFDTENEAHRIAWHSFRNLKDAILLVKSGQVESTPQRYFGGPIGGIKSTGSFPYFIPNIDITIRKRDAAQIVRAYKLISDKFDKPDKVLSTALHRFIMGRKRLDLTDKFIDYTISWESLILTRENKAVFQELRYRFAINGSSLICKMARKKDRKKYFKIMKYIYDLRSNIVHGGDNKERDKTLRKGGFTNLGEVCIFLEDNFRAAIWWLLSLELGERPYIKEDGWEDLLWS